MSLSYIPVLLLRASMTYYFSSNPSHPLAELNSRAVHEMEGYFEGLAGGQEGDVEQTTRKNKRDTLNNITV